MKVTTVITFGEGEGLGLSRGSWGTPGLLFLFCFLTQLVVTQVCEYIVLQALSMAITPSPPRMVKSRTKSKGRVVIPKIMVMVTVRTMVLNWG